jgi:hypothetical protein
MGVQPLGPSLVRATTTETTRSERATC